MRADENGRFKSPTVIFGFSPDGLQQNRSIPDN